MKTTGVEDEPNERPDYAECADFDAFSRWHRPRLVQWYRRHGLSREDAADVAQEALAGLARRWRGLTTEEHRKRSYYTITKHKLADFWRKQERRIQPDVSLDDDSGAELVADELETNPDVMVTGGGDHRVWTGVERLPEARRYAVLGRVVHRMSYDELAEASGRTKVAVRQDVARGLAWLRWFLKGGACVLGGWAARLRRRKLRSAEAGLAPASSTGLAVVPQGALLSLLVTSPLHVLSAPRAVAHAATGLTRVAVEALPGPVRDGVAVIAFPATTARVRRHVRAPAPRGAPRLLNPAATVVATPVPPLDPPPVCLKNHCGTGERITVTVLGHSVTVPVGSMVKVCWAVPAQAAPHVTCSKASDSP